ncbi:hemerythrin domain-containing protein [Spirillospora sp. CA-294931]|uniref:hemerythrin domain-containing protein n=1 Tax=Spirillospora sp. CA-294931 TaxID=3240042 RepID=UPI003D91F496
MSAGNGVVAAIKDDHRELERMFDRLADRPDAALLAEMSALFLAHGKAEEAEVYPKMLERGGPDDKEEVFHGVEEHREAEELLRKLQGISPGGPGFKAALKKFVDAVSHHVEEEESEVLPALDRKMDAAESARAEKAFRAAEAAEKKRLSTTSGRDLDVMTKEELIAQANLKGLRATASSTKDELKTELRAALHP